MYVLATHELSQFFFSKTSSTTDFASACCYGKELKLSQEILAGKLYSSDEI